MAARRNPQPADGVQPVLDEIFLKIVDKMPKLDMYDGMSNDLDFYFEYFLGRMWAFSVHRQYFVKLFYLNLKAGSEIEQYCTKNRDNIGQLSWDEFSDMLMNTFGNKYQEAANQDMILNFKMNPDETIDQVRYRFAKLVSLSKESIDSNMVIRLFIKGLPETYKSFISSKLDLSKRHNFADIISSARAAEYHYKVLVTSSDNSKSNSSPSIDIPDTDETEVSVHFTVTDHEMKNLCHKFLLHGVCKSSGSKKCKFIHKHSVRNSVINKLYNDVISYNKKTKHDSYVSSSFSFTVNLKHFRRNKSHLIFDTGANTHITNNLSILRDVKPLVKPLQVKGIGSSIQASHIGTFEFGDCLYCKDIPVSILSWSRIEDQFKMTSDKNKIIITSQEDVNNKYTFKKTNGLYVYNFDKSYTINAAEISKVYGNKTKADKVKALHQILGHPSDDVLERSIKFLPCKITSSDMKTYKHYYPTCDVCTSAKATSTLTKHNVVDKTIKIAENWHADIFTLSLADNSKQFYLLLVEEVTGYIYSSYLPTKSSVDVQSVLKKFINTMKTFKHVVRKIFLDNETSLKYQQEFLLSQGILAVFVAPSDHVVKAERAIRTIRQQIRALTIGLPYKLPTQWYKYAVMWASDNLNFLTNTNMKKSCSYFKLTKHSLSSHFFDLAFGQIVLVTNPKQHTSGVTSKAQYAVVLSREIYTNGCYQMYMIDNNQILTRRRYYYASPEKSIMDKLITQINGTPKYVPERHASEHPSPQLSITPFVTKETQVQMNNDESAHQDVDFQVQSDAEIMRNIENNIHSSTNQALQDGYYLIENVIAHRPKSKGRGLEYLVKYHGYPNTDNRWVPKSWITGFDAEALNKTPSYDEYLLQQNLEQTSVLLSYTAVNPRNKDLLEIAAQRAELKSMLDLQVFDPISPENVTDHVLKRSVITFMQTKDKFAADGNFIKKKARLICDGSSQPLLTVPKNCTSPTIRATTVKMLLCIAIKYRYHISSLDVSSAFLNAEIQEDVYIKLPKLVAQQMVELEPNYKKYMTSYGNIYIKLRKALYGLIQSPAAWYQTMHKVLKSIGFHQSSFDKCLFINSTNGMLVGVHVDDFLVIAKNSGHIKEFHEALLRHFSNVSIDQSPCFSYIGLNIKINSTNQSIELSQIGYIDKILAKYKIRGTASSPCGKYLFKDPNSHNKTDESTTKKYLSMVMSLSFLVATRPEIGTAVNYLSTKAKAPSDHDWNALYRVFKYLNASKNQKLVLKPKSLVPHVYCDASYSIYKTGQGVNGVVISLGPIEKDFGAAIYTHSKKQKIICTSSAESELVSIHSSMQELIFIKQILQELKFVNAPAKLFCDNKPALNMSNKGYNSFSKSRHINVRFFYVTSLIENKQITVHHMSTKDMPSDILTKALSGSRFIYLRNLICQDFK